MTEVIYLLCVILLNVCANLFMRSGAMEGGAGGMVSIFLNWKSMVGVLCFGAAAVFYLLLLKKVPLSLAQGFVALQFLLTVVAAQVVLGEKLDWTQWVAVTLIAIGIALLGWRSAINDQIGL